MNKAYIDLLDLPTNAVLVYIPENPEPINNLLNTKFPNGFCGEDEVWGNGYQDSVINNIKQLVVWFYCNVYSHKEFLEDMDMLGYTVVRISQTFHNFDKMEKYIEENNL
jgi:hypothetical protein